MGIVYTIPYLHFTLSHLADTFVSDLATWLRTINAYDQNWSGENKVIVLHRASLKTKNCWTQCRVVTGINKVSRFYLFFLVVVVYDQYYQMLSRRHMAIAIH